MKFEEVNTLLIHKYNQPVPRYTSYPTIPHWSSNPDIDSWVADFIQSFENQNHISGISIYIHLPFCESLCTYCGCNKKITTNHTVEDEYIKILEKDWKQYRRLMNQTPIIREIHLGGGTPTFFSPKNLERIINFLRKDSIIHPHHEFSIEGHPNNTTKAHLNILNKIGFKRISFGVQDNDPVVQQIINRQQPWQNVESATCQARQSGFLSVNFDLIYGLPMQTLNGLEDTFEHVVSLKPDRIAFYSYAHVPWTSRAQRLFNKSHLPDAEQKIALYLKGKEILLQNGYTDIGMDHFAMPGDDLFIAWKQGNLHRNFMGYTTTKTSILIGLGVSAISETGNSYAQNAKTLHDYYERVNASVLPVQKTYRLSNVDAAIKKYILEIACKGETNFQPPTSRLLEEAVFPKLLELEKDGLIYWNTNGLKLSDQGRYFIRNICSAFDMYLHPRGDKSNLYSRSI